MNGGRGLFRGPLYEGLAKLAPFFIFIILAIVIAASVRNFIDERAHPELRGSRFDPAQDFSHINSAGMVRALFKKPADRRDQEI